MAGAGLSDDPLSAAGCGGVMLLVAAAGLAVDEPEAVLVTLAEGFAQMDDGAEIAVRGRVRRSRL